MRHAYYLPAIAHALQKRFEIAFEIAGAKPPVKNFPDPPTLAFFGKSKGNRPKKARVFLFAEPLKSLEKKGKTHKKAREIGKRKKQGNRKKQGLEGQGFRQLNMVEL